MRQGHGSKDRGLPRAAHRVPIACLALFLVVAAALGAAPRYRDAWLLENLPVVIALAALGASYSRFRFSDRAYVQATAFLILHSVGSHYTYAEVPLGFWVKDAFDLSRNHYDRMVHFTSGLLLYRPMLELALRCPAAYRKPPARAGVRALARGPFKPAVELALGVAFIAGLSGVYEVIEWLTAIVVDPRAGTAFLGVQGDAWDAQKDMACAMTGALVAVAIEVIAARRARGWRRPLGARPDPV